MAKNSQGQDGGQGKDTGSLGQFTGEGAELHEITPLGLSAEQMAKSNPQEFEKVKQQASEEAVKADRKRLEDLKAAFPTDSEFALEAYGKGLGVVDAKAERHDILQERVTKLETENAELKEKAQEGIVEFAESETEGTGTGKAAMTTEDQQEGRAKSLWNADAKLRDEFAGNFSTFYADWKRNPGDYAAPKK